jgi:hypothetical protein
MFASTLEVCSCDCGGRKANEFISKGFQDVSYNWEQRRAEVARISNLFYTLFGSGMFIPDPESGFFYPGSGSLANNLNIFKPKKELDPGYTTLVLHSVADLYPDPYVFGPPGSRSISQRYGSESLYHQAKIVRKTLISTVL